MFLAMAHWQLGNKERARRMYHEGVAWIAANRKGTDKCKRLRTAAGQLLGLSEAEQDELMATAYAAVDLVGAPSLIARGHWHQANGDHEKAIEDFTAALRLQPESQDSTLWRSRGRAYFVLKQYEEAVSDLSKAIQLNADDQWSLFIRAATRQELGQLDLALVDFTKAIDLKPSARKVYVYRARIHRDLGDFEAALADCQQAIDLDPERDERWFRREEAYVLRGDVYADDLQQYDKAAEEYAKALELDPQDAAIAEKRDHALQASEPPPEADEPSNAAEPLATAAK